MKFRALKSIGGAMAGLWLALSPAMAEEVAGRFDLSLKGLRAGQLAFAATLEAGAYTASGDLRTTGLAALFRKVHYKAEAQGAWKGGLAFQPKLYREDADTGKRQSQAEMAYRAGVPQVKSYNPPRAPRPYDVEPGAMGGTLDPLTALIAVMAPVEREGLCGLKLKLFDGRRASQVVLAPVKAPSDGAVECAGEYRRLGGFSPEDMAEKTRFPFRLTYRARDDGRWEVEEVAMETLFGPARLTRR